MISVPATAGFFCFFFFTLARPYGTYSMSFYTMYDLWLRLHSAVYRRASFVLMLRYCANFKAVRHESTS